MWLFFFFFLKQRHSTPFCSLIDSSSQTRFVDEDRNNVLSGHIYWTLMEEGRLYYFGKKALNLMPPSNSFPVRSHS